MATKTISIELDVYDALKARRLTPSESFSQLLRRILASGQVVTGADFARMIETGAIKRLSDEELAYFDKVLADEQAPPIRKRKAE